MFLRRSSSCFASFAYRSIAIAFAGALSACSGAPEATRDSSEPILFSPVSPAPESFVTIMSRFTNFDLDGDNTAEINSLKPAFPNPEEYSPAPKGVVLVMVNPSLVSEDTSVSRFEMLLWLGILSSDLARDGYFPYFVEADVYHGGRDQDGRTLLGIRRFFQSVKASYPLAGAIMLGSFPEAGIVRTTLIKTHSASFTTGHGRTVPDVDILTHNAEYVTPRGEIVLADLDGNWESLYRENAFTINEYDLLPPSGIAFPQSGQTFDTPDFVRKDFEHTFKDVFLIDDAQVNIFDDGAVAHVAIATIDERNRETTAADRAQTNRIARPEIVVSRIDAKHVAINPYTTAPDLDGKTPLDATGKPQSLRFGERTDLLWKRDPTLERKLVASYIARAHTFRNGGDNDKPFRTAAINTPNSGLTASAEFNTILRRAADGFTTSIAKENASLVDYVNWLATPAVLRGVAAHSEEWESGFGTGYAPAAIDAAIGGHAWHWAGAQVGSEWRLTPTLDGMQGLATFHLYRSLYENGVLAKAGQTFIVHEGCDVMKPSNYRVDAYTDESYGILSDGRAQNAESILFYANALGIVGRNKVFYDKPEGFAEAVKAKGRFGDGWAGYFATDAANAGLDERALPYGNARATATLARKKAYYWSLLGDWTLALRY